MPDCFGAGQRDAKQVAQLASGRFGQVMDGQYGVYIFSLLVLSDRGGVTRIEVELVAQPQACGGTSGA